MSNSILNKINGGDWAPATNMLSHCIQVNGLLRYKPNLYHQSIMNLNVSTYGLRS